MAGGNAYRIVGLRELLRVTDQLPKVAKRAVRDEIRAVAVPIRDEATSRFRDLVSDDPAKSRYGITVRRTGIVSIEQRVKSKQSRENKRLKRPKFADLQIDEVLIPAADHNEMRVEAALDNVLKILQREWGTG